MYPFPSSPNNPVQEMEELLSQTRPQPGQWLHLENAPASWSEHEALLLCQISPQEWITWIPNYGEYYLIL